ncbi:MAG: class I SAM-dependent methyltransferase [Phycisphaerales bacterium]
MDIDSKQLDRVAEDLGQRDGLFLKRVLSDGLETYRRRLKAIGFDKLESVLDAGCGFGQWSLALASTARRVEAIDTDETRIRTARRLAEGRANLNYHVGSLETLPFDDETFDGVFCYSVIYYTDVRRSIDELCRVLRPGGLIYISSNGLGWYIQNLLMAPNTSSDFHPRLYAIRTMLGSLKYRLLGIPPRDGNSVVTGRRWLTRKLMSRHVELIGVGDEGSVSLVKDMKPEAFFRGRYFGLDGVSEWLGRRTGIASNGEMRTSDAGASRSMNCGRSQGERARSALR